MLHRCSRCAALAEMERADPKVEAEAAMGQKDELSTIELLQASALAGNFVEKLRREFGRSFFWQRLPGRGKGRLLRPAWRLGSAVDTTVVAVPPAGAAKGAAARNNFK